MVCRSNTMTIGRELVEMKRLSSVEQLRDRRRRSDLVCDIIRERIALGGMRPGERIRQEVLARELQVSQATVRESIRMLAAEGIVVSVPYKGARTVLLPLAELRDAFELRGMLEGLGLEAAASRISHDDLVRMRKLLPLTVVGKGPETTRQAWESNREFHMIAMRASGRPQLARFVEQLLDRTNPYAVLADMSENARTESAEYELKEHTRILEVLEERNGQLAKKLIEEHLASVLRQLELLLPDTETLEESQPPHRSRPHSDRPFP